MSFIGIYTFTVTDIFKFSTNCHNNLKFLPQFTLLSIHPPIYDFSDPRKIVHYLFFSSRPVTMTYLVTRIRYSLSQKINCHMLTTYRVCPHWHTRINFLHISFSPDTYPHYSPSSLRSTPPSRSSCTSL